MNWLFHLSDLQQLILAMVCLVALIATAMALIDETL